MTKPLVNQRKHQNPAWAFFSRFEIPNYLDEHGGTYLTRWRLIATPLGQIMVHRMTAPDPMPTLHDHPWSFVSVVLRGGYTEFARSARDWIYAEPRRVRWFNFKRAEDAHWIETLDQTPTWTLVICGPRRREWGFIDHDRTWTRWDQHPNQILMDAALARRKGNA